MNRVCQQSGTKLSRFANHKSFTKFGVDVVADVAHIHSFQHGERARGRETDSSCNRIEMLSQRSQLLNNRTHRLTHSSAKVQTAFNRLLSRNPTGHVRPRGCKHVSPPFRNLDIPVSSSKPQTGPLPTHFRLASSMSRFHSVWTNFDCSELFHSDSLLPKSTER